MSVESTARPTAADDNAADDKVRPLRLALRLDAAASGASAVLLLAAGAFVTDLIGLPLVLLWGAGAFLAPFAAGLWLLARRTAVPAAGIRAVVAINTLWVLGSILVLVLLPMTGAGTVVVGAQAAAVAAFAVAQTVGLRALDV